MGFHIDNYDDAGGDWTPCPPGGFRAIILAVHDTGWQTPYQNDATKKCSDTMVVDFEIDEEMESGKRYILQKQMTKTLREKATLREVVHAAFPAGLSDEQRAKFDVTQLVGKAVSVVVDWNQAKTRTQIKSVTAMPKGTSALDPTELGTYDEPFGLAAYLIENKLSPEAAKDWEPAAPVLITSPRTRTVWVRGTYEERRLHVMAARKRRGVRARVESSADTEGSMKTDRWCVTSYQSGTMVVHQRGVYTPHFYVYAAPGMSRGETCQTLCDWLNGLAPRPEWADNLIRATETTAHHPAVNEHGAVLPVSVYGPHVETTPRSGDWEQDPEFKDERARLMDALCGVGGA